MKNRLSWAAMGLVFLSGLALAQNAPQYGPAPAYPNPPAANPNPGAVTPQTLGEMLRSATTFHELVRSMNLNQSLGRDVHFVGPDGKIHHSVERTAATIGAGAGAGAAIGAMSHSQNGVLIGALVGGAGGFILDEILKHREETREHSVYGPVAPPAAKQPGFRQREQDHDGDRNGGRTSDDWHRLGQPEQRMNEAMN